MSETWFDQVQVDEEADEAAQWAATREFELRYRRAELARGGITAGLRKAAQSMQRLNQVLAGDPSVPTMGERPAIHRRAGW